jgi:hypothetical protein
LNRIISDEFEMIDGELIVGELQSTVEELYQDIEPIDPELTGQLIRSVMSQARRMSLDNGIVLHHSDLFILPSAIAPGHMFLVSDGKDSVDNHISELNSRISEISEIASDFGLNIELLRGEGLAEALSSNFGSEVVEREDFDNEFEEVVYSDIENEITRCLDDNVVLRFGDEDPEIFECDIVIHLDPISRIIVEVKDESHDEANLGKSKLIDTPRDKSDIIRSEEDSTRTRYRGLPGRTESSTECFVIVRGIDEDRFEQHKQKANRRDIRLLKYDDEKNYLESVEAAMKNIIRK